ncbi:MAG: hypothetical protein EOO45_00280 [Flavobacterium sp.]|nr:MAG: hypothetical protein EOO45_00280 [Flavobacterium sp.]
MKIKFILILIYSMTVFQSFGQQVLGNFSASETFEWPQVTWYRDLNNNWDEGLIKTAANTGGVIRSGFGIHFNETRQFTFWSTYLNPLLSIEGGSGKTYIKGNVGIGTLNPLEKLSVKGKIRAQEVKVDMNGWADFVFTDHYKLLSLDSLANYIQMNKHLPGIPSTAEVLQNGIALGEMNKNLLQKVEELSLYAIEQNKIIKAQATDLKMQKETNLLVKKEIELLKEQIQKVLIR